MAELAIVVRARDEASRTLEGISSKIQGMSGQLKTAGIAMAAVGAAITGAIALSVRSFMQMGDEIQKMSIRTGFSTEALSELRHAADLSGTTLQGMEVAIKRMSSVLSDAEGGMETSQKAFKALGVSYKSLKGLSPEQQFMTLLTALAGVENQTKKTALAQDLFGRSGTDLLPMLANGAEGLAKMRQEAHTLGIVFDKETAAKAAEFQDALTRAKAGVNGLKMEIAKVLLPTLMPLVDRLTEIVKQVGLWARINPELFRGIAKTVLVVGILFTGFGALAIMLPTLIGGFRILIATLAFFTTPLGAAVLALGVLFLLFEKSKDDFAEFNKNIDESGQHMSEWTRNLEYSKEQWKLFWAESAKAWQPTIEAWKQFGRDTVKAWEPVIEDIKEGWNKFWAWLGTLKFPDITLPEWLTLEYWSAIKFPSIEFPSINIPDITLPEWLTLDYWSTKVANLWYIWKELKFPSLDLPDIAVPKWLTLDFWSTKVANLWAIWKEIKFPSIEVPDIIVPEWLTSSWWSEKWEALKVWWEKKVKFPSIVFPDLTLPWFLTISGWGEKWDGLLAWWKENVHLPPIGFPGLTLPWFFTASGWLEKWEDIKEVFRTAMNFIIGLAESWANVWVGAVNIIIGALNKIQFTVPDIKGMPHRGESFGINIYPVSEVSLPRLGGGGIVRSPTLALIGEAGPEAVVPLDRMGVVEVKIINYGVIGVDDLDKVIHRSIRDGIRRGAFEGVL